MNQQSSSGEPKSRTVAILLTLFLGGFGGQYFYYGRVNEAVFSVLLSTTGVPFVLSVIHFVELIKMSDEAFQKKYGQAKASKRNSHSLGGTGKGQVSRPMKVDSRKSKYTNYKGRVKHQNKLPSEFHHKKRFGDSGHIGRGKDTL
jgi:TM2 domain-containing membrane protein YozV